VPAALLLLAGLVGCGSQTGATAGSGLHSRGPVDVWAGPLPSEVAWTQKIAASWNRTHPDQHVSVTALPASRSTEEVLTAAVTAGNTACLVDNTSPAAVPDFQRMGGLVPLNDFPGAVDYLTARSGPAASQYRSADGKYYQLPWKQNPAMLYYDKKVFRAAGIDPDHPGLSTWAGFLAAARRIKATHAAQAAVWPPPTAEWYNSWFDFYAFFTAQTGQQLLAHGTPAFTSADGQRVAALWRTLYTEKLAPVEAYPGSDAFADGKAGMAVWGSDLLPSYRAAHVDYGVVPIPTAAGSSAGHTASFSNEKSWGMYSACRNKATAWDFLRYATSPASDRLLLEDTGELPVRTGLATRYAAFFRAHPELRPFAEQSAHTVEVPSVVSGVDVWTAFRAAWEKAVIFRQEPVSDAFAQAARTIRKITRP
jgi:multiple sugar transport system substrate-binding protein